MHEIHRFYSFKWAIKFFKIVFIVWRGMHRQFLVSPIMGLRWPISVENRREAPVFDENWPPEAHDGRIQKLTVRVKQRTAKQWRFLWIFWWIMKLGSCRFNADVDARALPQILRSERGPGHASICSSFPDFGWFFFVIFSSIFLKFSVPGARSRRVLTLNEERIEKFVARGEKWFFENCTFSTLTGPFSAVSARNFESKTIWVRNSTRSNRICKKKKSKIFRFFIEIFDDHKSAKSAIGAILQKARPSEFYPLEEKEVKKKRYPSGGCGTWNMNIFHSENKKN